MGPGAFQAGLELYEVAGPAGLYLIRPKVGHWLLPFNVKLFLPKASFGLWLLLLPASVCVCQRFCVCSIGACPLDNSSAIPTSITEFGQSMQTPLFRSYCFEGWLTLTFDVKLNLKIQISHYGQFVHQSKYTTIRVNTKVIFDSFQLIQMRVFLILQSLITHFEGVGTHACNWGRDTHLHLTFVVGWGALTTCVFTIWCFLLISRQGYFCV